LIVFPQKALNQSQLMTKSRLIEKLIYKVGRFLAETSTFTKKS